MMNYSSRLTQAEQSLSQLRLDALIVTHLPNIRYLCGFTGSAGALAFARGDWAFFTDGRYTEQARIEVKNARILVEGSSPVIQAVRWLAGKFKRSRAKVAVGVESEHLTLATRTRLESEIKRHIPKSKFRLVGTTDLVERLRLRKDSDEIAAIRRAVNLASGIFPKVSRAIRPGISENDLAAELEYLARRAGAEKMSFETIVASGPRSAMPHARPTRSRVRSGFVVLDYGVILGGYCSDMTRTVCIGNAGNWCGSVYDAVLEAQLAGIAAVRPGVQCQEVDGAARRVLQRHKLARFFTHSLGHGVGLEIHEAPRLAKGQSIKLEAGMVVTIEPGVYVPGRGGVRIEDMVLITAKGCEVLTSTPKELVIC